MKAALTRLYVAGKITDADIDQAVARGWITQAEADDIKQ